MSNQSGKKYLRRTDSRRNAVSDMRGKSRDMVRPPRGPIFRKGADAANFVDIGAANYACDTTGSLTLLNPVPLGTGQSSRVGKRIKSKSLQLRGFIFPGSAIAFAHTTMFIVYDRRPSGALPAITDILDTVNSLSFLNDSNSNRFKILKRKDIVIAGTSASVMDTENFAQDIYMKIPEKYAYTSYKTLGTGAIADFDEGALYLVTVGSVAPGTTAPNYRLGVRYRYYDQPQ